MFYFRINPVGLNNFDYKKKIIYEMFCPKYIIIINWMEFTSIFVMMWSETNEKSYKANTTQIRKWNSWSTTKTLNLTGRQGHYDAASTKLT